MAQSSNHYEIITQTLLYRAKLQDRLLNPDGALEETRRAVEMTESLRANIVLPEDRSRLTASRIQVYEQMVERLCNLNTVAGYAEAFHYAEMSKSRTLIEMLAGRPIRPPEHVPAEWLEQERELRRSLHRLYHDPGASRAQIATFEAELDQLREHIRLRDTEFESFRTVTPLTLDAVQAQLPEGGVLLEYFTAGETILVFVVTHQEVNVVRLPLRLNELRRAFKRVGGLKSGPLHNMVRNEQYRLRSPWILGNLYQKLIEPLEQALHSASLLCIVPHGLLHYVPFHALYRQTNSGTRYLIEDGDKARQIVYAPSATVLFDYCQNKPLSSKMGCLALGYNNQTLTQAEREAEAVAELLGGESQTGAAATRSTLITKGADYRYIHLSCHGWFNATWPMASSLALADHTLDVADVLRELQFDAELVCLSACEAGRSRVLWGDELVGLVRAFLYAGTPSVVVSQWVVDELATRLFMERFYQEIIDCAHRIKVGAKALALSRAQIYLKNLTLDELRPLLHETIDDAEKADQQLQFLSDSLDLGPIETLRGDECLLAHPYYWASFFIVGDRLSFV
jgi:CHAT domain-containing protein